ncbi:MAG: hypothetical protein IT258_06700 [Saprospiraceae bacterium]|nr:hypothetical protein [Saprospiraceae bacterium]
MKDFIGINTRVTDPIKYISKFQSIREYNHWSGTIGFDANNIENCPSNKLRFNPSANSASLDNFDAFYQQLSARIHPSFKWLAPEMRGLTQFNEVLLEQKPLCLSGIPGAGNTPNGTSNQQLEKFFNIGAILRKINRENLASSTTRSFKSYVNFDNIATSY